jgi:adenylylsulfate reductase subunit B
MAIERINAKLCNGCGICVKICPMDVFRINAKRKKAVITYAEDCMACEFCVIDCPTKAITVTSKKSSPLILSWG